MAAEPAPGDLGYLLGTLLLSAAELRLAWAKLGNLTEQAPLDTSRSASKRGCPSENIRIAYDATGAGGMAPGAGLRLE